jgi:predicted DNA-binding transcriptional regulator AlpA
MRARTVEQVAVAVRGLSRERAAQYIGVSASSFDKMVGAGEMPKPRLWGARRLWDVRELDAAFEELPHDGKPEATGWEDIVNGANKTALRA